MAKKHSKHKKKHFPKEGMLVDKTVEKALASEPKRRPSDERFGWRAKILRAKGRVKEEQAKRILPHKSFRRSYREDYKREVEVPGMFYHALAAFRIIAKNWKLFVPLIIIVVVLNVIFVGLMSESSYAQFRDLINQTGQGASGGDIGNVAKAGILLFSTITTGGLSSDSNEETTVVFAILFFLVIWLTTIFLLRHLLAGRKVKLRDGLYNSMGPLISTFVVFAVAVVECIPIFFLVIAYSAAVQTDFLATPFYALVFFVFAGLMLLISGYLLSTSLMTLIAVSAPGVYPINAFGAASDLMMGRRVKLILRLIFLIIVVAIMWIVIMVPLILFDMGMKQFEWTAGIPFVSICLMVMTCFTAVYVTTYLYLYYRWMLEYDTVEKM